MSKYLLNKGITYIKENYNQDTLVADIKKKAMQGQFHFLRLWDLKKECEIRNGSALRFIYRG